LFYNTSYFFTRKRTSIISFLRQTKKAYISFVTPEMIDLVKGSSSILDDVPTLNAITLACRRKGLKMEMYLTRKIFASWLRKEGIQPEVVDILQGRASQSVLTRHFLVPENSLKDQVLDALEKLQKEHLS
jgi:intergrase/recombinase